MNYSKGKWKGREYFLLLNHGTFEPYDYLLFSWRRWSTWTSRYLYFYRYDYAYRSKILRLL